MYDGEVLDPNFFRPNTMREQRPFWAKFLIPEGTQHRELLLDCLGDVDVTRFFAPFTGEFEGERFDGVATPPRKVFDNYGIEGVTVSTGETAEAWVAKKVRGMLTKGLCRPWGSDPRDSAIGSRPTLVNAVTVEPDKPRLILATVFLNLFTKMFDFHPGQLNYATEVPAQMGRQPYMSDHDLHSHYDHYGLAWNSQHLFGLCVDLLDGRGPQDFVLVAGGFGWCGWPWIANEHRWLKDQYVRSLGGRVLSFFDDSLLGGRARPVNACNRSAGELCEQFSVPACTPAQLLLAHECGFLNIYVSTMAGYFFSIPKSNWVPRMTLTWTGTVLCGKTEMFIAMPKKVARVKCDSYELQAACAAGRTVRLRFLQKLAGRAQCIAVACMAVRCYVKYLFSEVNKHCRQFEYSTADRAIPTTPMMMRVATVLIRLPNDAFQHPWLGDSHVQCCSDASDNAWSLSMSLSTSGLQHGEIFAGRDRGDYEAVVEHHQRLLPSDLVAAGTIPERYLAFSIGWKELYAIVAGIWALVQRHGPSLVYGKRLDFVLDNLGDVYILRSGGSTVESLNQLMEILFWLQVQLKFHSGLPAWVSTLGNVFLDAYTRMPAYIDAALSDMVFDLLELRWGPFEVDVMATDATAKCDRFFSRFACPNAEATDVFSQDLSGLLCYCFPPTQLVMPFLLHLRDCRGRAVVVLPSETSVWTPLLVGACVDCVSFESDMVPFAFDSSRRGRLPSRAYNGVPYCAVLLNFAQRRLAC